MSSESDSEEFYDAVDVSPNRPTHFEETSSSSRIATTCIENRKLQHMSILPQQSESSFFGENVTQKCNQFQWRSRNTSPRSESTATLPSLSGKLASSLPTLHLQENSFQSQLSAQSMLLALSKPFSKDDSAHSQMPPPRELPPKSKLVEKNQSANASCQNETKESTSVCSGSLLDTLGLVETESNTELVWRGRRARRRKSKHVSREENDPTTGSPPDSPTSSADSFFPLSQTSVPFRVVEVDATSVYSTTFSQDKGSKVSQKSEPKEGVSINLGDKQAVVEDQRHTQVAEPEDIALSPEPDVVASTKANSLPRFERPPTNDPATFPIQEPLPATDSGGGDRAIDSPQIFVVPPPPPPVPVAPPRRNKRRKRDEDTTSLSSVISLPTPEFTLPRQEADVISRHLDLQEASKGDYIVSPLDTEKCRAPRPSESDFTRIDSTGDTTSQASTPEAGRRPSQGSAHRRDAASLASSISSKHNTPSSEAVSSCSNQSQMPRPKTDISILTDEEILKQVSVLNLDTGERIPLSEAEECLPNALNPLSLHIMRLTSEYISSKSDEDDEEEEESDEESVTDESVMKLPEIDVRAVKKRTSKLKKFLGKTMGSAVHKAKTLAQEVSQRNREEKDVFEDDAPAQNTMQYVKIKTTHSHKGPHEFDNLMYVQELKGEHTGPVWCMKFSPCGRLLATAGQDHILRVWVLKQAFSYFLDIRTKWNADVKSSPTPSQESLVSQHSSHSGEDLGTLDPYDDGLAPFMPKPFCVYFGHTADVLDLSWSKNYFMLTSSMDKTVRLWHISRKECLCIFKHVDFVTAIAFHPKDDRYFISGSLDGKLRLWSIPDKQVVMWNEVEGQPKLITAANFCQNGAFTVVGTYNGRCIFYKTEELKYFTQIHVKSSRGKNARGRKITGIEPLPDKDMLMITSNDSRIRLYDLNVFTVACKYKGYSNISSQIRAGFSHDGKYIVAGSENQCIYIWKTQHDYSKFSSARKDRNLYWEGVKAHSAVVTCAIFSPRPDHVFNFIEQQEAQNKQREENDGGEPPPSELPPANNAPPSSNKGYVLVSADFNGCIKVFLKKEKPKYSSLPASALA